MPPHRSDHRRRQDLLSSRTGRHGGKHTERHHHGKKSDPSRFHISSIVEHLRTGVFLASHFFTTRGAVPHSWAFSSKKHPLDPPIIRVHPLNMVLFSI
jgi:hypothetical protein